MRGPAARGSIGASALVQACASLGALSAGAIHLSTASEHDGLYAAGFLAMAAFQGAWALLAALRPSARLMALGIAGNVAIVAIWYERVEPMLSALLRDMDAVPIVKELQAGRLE